MYSNKKNLVSIFTILFFLIFAVGFFGGAKNISALTCPGLNPAVNYGMICSSASLACSPNAGSLSCGGAICGTPYYNYANQCVANCTCTDINQGGNSFSNASCSYDANGNGVCNYNFDGPYCTIDFGPGSMALPASGCVSQSAAESCIYNPSGPQLGVQCGGSGSCYGFKSCQPNNFYGACDFSMTNGNACTNDGGVTAGKCNAGTCIPIIPGACGPSNGANLYTAPVGGLCNSGSVSSVSGIGPWSWKCLGSGGGSDDSCSAKLKQDASCGSAAKSYLSTDTVYSGTYCTTGTLNGGAPAFPAQGSSTNWSCNGINGGLNASSCVATRAAAMDFSVSASAYPTAITGGSVSSITITLSPINGFNSPVTVTAPAGITPGTATISGGSGAAVFTYQSSAPDSGTKTFTFSAVSGSLSHTASANVAVSPALPTVSLTADAGSVSYNGSTNLRWTSTNATACTASGGWSGSQATSGGPVSTGSLASNKTYTIICTGPGGSSNPSSVTVAVGAPPIVVVSLSASPNPINYNTNSVLSWTVQNATACTASGGWSGGKSVSGGTEATSNLLADKTYILTCTGPGSPSGVSASVILAVNAPPPVSISLAASPNSVAYGGSSSLSWTVQNATACTASANMPTGNWTTGGSNNGVTTGALTSNQTYSLNCTGPGTAATASVNLTVGVVNGDCGLVNGSVSANIPVANLCNTSFGSTPNVPNYSGGVWTWVCNGSLNGGNPSPICSVIKQASCGSAQGGNFQTVPSSNLCSVGSNSSPVQNGSVWNWICNNGSSNQSCSANVIIPGSCGTANAKIYAYGTTGYGTDTQCSPGTPSSTLFPTAGNSAPWTCSGINGGSLANCSASQAPAPIPGSCGTADKSNFYTQPATNLCNSTGAAPTVSGSGPWSWTCTGQNGGANASCSANKNDDGVCGSAANPSIAQPTTNLCATTYGNTAVSGSGPWTWDCNPLNSGVKASCTALKQTIGSCGTANKTYPNTATGFGSDTLCFAGTANPASPAFPGFDSSSPWKCLGSNGGADASCQASMGAAPILGVCGTADKSNFYTQPATNLCNSTGAAPTVSGSGPWSWTCTGQNGGANASCSANKSIDPVCGTASTNYSYTATAFSGTYCAPGNVLSIPAFPAPGGSTVWSCQGINTNNTISCPATVTATPIPGACGTADTKVYPYGTAGYGTDTQCSLGTPSNTSFPIAGNSAIWTCSGINGGSNSSNCSASQAPAPVNGQCNMATNGQSFYSAPTTNLCSNGNPSLIPSGPGPWSWTCNGLNGGSGNSCSATVKVDGLCGASGASNEQNFFSAPTTDLCATTYGSNPSTLSGPGPWSWTCNGSNGGASSPTCSANQSITAACGSAATTYSSSATTYSGSFCSPGTLVGNTPAFPVQGGSSTWNCNGLYGGNPSGTCTATRGLAPVRGQCGSADNGSNSDTIPTTNFCASVYGHSPVVDNGSSWSWTCNGGNGGPSSTLCITNKTINGSCGLASGNYPYSATAYLGPYCVSGLPNSTPPFPSAGSSVAWTCLGQNGGSDQSCFATVAPTPINGVCGPASGNYSSTATAYNGAYCTAGSTNSTPPFPAPGGFSSWTCLGSNEGTSASCIASVAPASSYGTCGTAAGKTYPYGSTSYGSDTFCNNGVSQPANPSFPSPGQIVTWYCASGTGGSLCSATQATNSTSSNGYCTTSFCDKSKETPKDISTASNSACRQLGNECLTAVPVGHYPDGSVDCLTIYNAGCDCQYCSSAVGTPWCNSNNTCGYNLPPPSTQTPASAPTVILNANPTMVSYGNSTVLTWASTNAVSCTGGGGSGSDGWTGSKAISGTQTISNLTSSQTFTFSCVNSDGIVASQSVYVIVVPSSLTVTVNKTVGGSVRSADGFISCGSSGLDCIYTYLPGAAVTLSAYPDNSNWKFVGWTGDCTGSGNCNLTINSSKSVTPIFTPAPAVYKEF